MPAGVAGIRLPAPMPTSDRSAGKQLPEAAPVLLAAVRIASCLGGCGQPIKRGEEYVELGPGRPEPWCLDCALRCHVKVKA